MEKSRDDTSKIRRLVVVGDIHGCLEGFTRVMQLASFIDRKGEWRIAPGEHLVICGDMIDEGASSREVVFLIRRLTEEFSGRVTVLLGNHELLLLRTLATGDDRLNWETARSWGRAGGGERLGEYLDRHQVPSLGTSHLQTCFQQSLLEKGRVDYPEEYVSACAAIPTAVARQAAALLGDILEKDGTLPWLKRLPVAAKIGTWGFFHGGPPCGWTAGVAALNRTFAALLEQQRWDHPLLDPYAGRESPVAARHWWQDGEEAVDRLFEAYGMKQVAFGHSPGALNGLFGRLAQRWGKIFKADTYFSLGIEGYLEIVGDEVRAVYAEAGRRTFNRLYKDQPELPPAERLWPVRKGDGQA